MPTDWQSFWQTVCVGAGGFVGAISRFLINGVVHRWFPKFLPAGTLAVNLLGCFVIGILMALVAEREMLSASSRALWITGFLGSLTTFSTFGYETFALLRDRRWFAAGGNVAANVVLGLGAVMIGYALVAANA